LCGRGGVVTAVTADDLSDFAQRGGGGGAWWDFNQRLIQIKTKIRNRLRVQFQAVAANHAHFKKWVVVIFWFMAAGKRVWFVNSSTPWEGFYLIFDIFVCSYVLSRFIDDIRDLTRSFVAPFDIDTGLEKPINVPLRGVPPKNVPPRRVPPAHRIEIEKQLKDWKEAGLITESNSPWASPIVMVPKPNGSFHKLNFEINSKTTQFNYQKEKESYKLPQVLNVVKP
jgi:hypothetical protein